MHFSFNLLRIKGLYMFRALLSHPQEALQTALGILGAYNVSWLWRGSVKHALTRVWQELEYRIDVCRGTRCAHIEHL
jgi:hypothetical protein